MAHWALSPSMPLAIARAGRSNVYESTSLDQLLLRWRAAAAALGGEAPHRMRCLQAQQSNALLWRIPS